MQIMLIALFLQAFANADRTLTEASREECETIIRNWVAEYPTNADTRERIGRFVLEVVYGLEAAKWDKSRVQSSTWHDNQCALLGAITLA